MDLLPAQANDAPSITSNEIIVPPNSTPEALTFHCQLELTTSAILYSEWWEEQMASWVGNVA